MFCSIKKKSRMCLSKDNSYVVVNLQEKGKPLHSVSYETSNS